MAVTSHLEARKPKPPGCEDFPEVEKYYFCSWELNSYIAQLHLYLASIYSRIILNIPQSGKTHFTQTSSYHEIVLFSVKTFTSSPV